MSKLERWLPFKFKRKAKEDRGNVPVRVQGGAESAPGASSLAPWGAAHPFNPLLQSFFQEPLLRDPFSRWSEIDRWFGDFSPVRFHPNLDVVDEETSLKISAELPGIAKEDLEVALESGVLVLRGHKRNREESRENGIYRSERYYGYFERSVPLPEDVDPEKAEATYEHGVLTIRVPKTELRSAARRIPIRAAAS